MAEHTPGPWVWNTDRPEKYDLEWLDGSDGTRVFSNYGNGKMTPDLLVACQNIDLLYAEYMALRPDPNTEAFDRVTQAIRETRAAIAKAKGEQP